MIIERDSLNSTQQISYDLIKSDLSYLFTVINSINVYRSNYILSLIPYLGVIIDGVEDWIFAVNNSSKVKIEVPTFTGEEHKFYETIRSGIKLWEQKYDVIYQGIKTKYLESDEYFSGVCRPIAKRLKLYDIFGVDIVNGEFCGNTILSSYYVPFFSYNTSIGEYVRSMSMIGGRYIHAFNAVSSYSINPLLEFSIQDYGGIIKSPVGNKFSDRFLLLLMLSQINFVLYCIDQYIIEEIPTKLRFAYILYYYLLQILPNTNQANNTKFNMDDRWISRSFRNSMAHYKVGMTLKCSEIKCEDLMYGITYKTFGCDYMDAKWHIMKELQSLASQIKEYLGL